MAMIILTPWDWGSPWNPCDWSALNYRSLEQTPGPRVHLSWRGDEMSQFWFFRRSSVFFRVVFGNRIFSSSPLAVTLTSPQRFHQRSSPGSIIIPTNKITIIKIEFTMVIIIMTTMVTWSGSPPKYAMLSLTQTKASSWSLRPWEWPMQLLLLMMMLMMMLMIDDDNIDTMVRDSSQG